MSNKYLAAVYKVPLQSYLVKDGPSTKLSQRRYYNCGVFLYNTRTRLVGIHVDFNSTFEDPIDNWPYTLGVVVGDVNEWGKNPYIDVPRVSK